MLNHVTLMGRLTRDPELKTTPGGTFVCTVTLACDRDYARAGEQRETDFIDVVCWNQRAEFVSKYFRKGQLAAASGRLQTRKWVDNQGYNRLNFEVLADNFYFAERADSSSSAQAPSQSYSEAMSRDFKNSPEDLKRVGSGFAAYDDDDVPF